MPTEIERKFLVVGDAWRREVSRSERMAQGYLAGPPASKCSVRVRIAGDVAHLNIKSVTLGVERDEYEYEIPLADAERLLATLAGDRVEKMRHFVEIGEHVFEIDEFAGANAGLVVRARASRGAPGGADLPPAITDALVVEEAGPVRGGDGDGGDVRLALEPRPARRS